jgi:DNA adenine methylase
MQYLGGKSKIAKKLAAAIEPTLRGRYFWEPFCGGLSMSVALSAISPGYVTDGNPALIALYKAVAAGWQPPTVFSYDSWVAAKTLPDSDPLKAFAGIGCSFSGSWFLSYAKDNYKNKYASQASNTVRRDVARVVTAGCKLDYVDFLTVEPVPTRMIVYCDPPYAGTVGYAGVVTFDHALFYERVRGWSRHTDVFVSEYNMPWGSPIMEFEHVIQAGGGTSARRSRERLYHYGPGRP